MLKYIWPYIEINIEIYDFQIMLGHLISKIF